MPNPSWWSPGQDAPNPYSSAPQSQGHKTSEEPTGGRRQAGTSPDPGLQAAVGRFVVKGALGAEITATAPIYRLPEVDRPAWVGGLVGLLGLISGPGEVSVQQAGSQLVGHQGPDSAATNPVFPASWVVGGM